MTLDDLFESGVCLQGHIKIQCWESEVEPTVVYDGDVTEFCLGNHCNIIDREITYVFPYTDNYNEPAICIEIEEDIGYSFCRLCEAAHATVNV